MGRYPYEQRVVPPEEPGPRVESRVSANGKRKVLIISYPFPPRNTIGSQRFYRLSKYFPQFGWEPIVLTVKRPGNTPEGIRVISTDCIDFTAILKRMAGFRQDQGVHQQLGIKVSKNFNYSTWKSKAIKLVRDVVTFPDDVNGWYFYAVRAASEVLDKERVDAIVSTSDPVTSHLIARKLKRKYRIPWIADFRDLWTQNHYYDRNGLFRALERRIEVKTLSDADVLVTANPQVELFKDLHPDRRIVCVTNGYDPEDFTGEAGPIRDRFTITYTGTLYTGKRDPSMLFSVVARLIHEGKILRDRVEIRFFGCDEEWLFEEVKSHGLNDVVSIQGLVPRRDVLALQRESHLLLLLLWDNEKEEDICPGKLYEYLGARRPIIAIGGPGSAVRRLLVATNAGSFASDQEMLRRSILSYYEEYKSTGSVANYCTSAVERYSYRAITKQYAELLDSLAVK